MSSGDSPDSAAALPIALLQSLSLEDKPTTGQVGATGADASCSEGAGVRKAAGELKLSKTGMLELGDGTGGACTDVDHDSTQVSTVGAAVGQVGAGLRTFGVEIDQDVAKLGTVGVEVDQDGAKGGTMQAEVGSNLGKFGQVYQVSSNLGKFGAEVGTVSDESSKVASELGGVTADGGNIRSDSGNVSSGLGGICAEAGESWSKSGNVSSELGEICAEAGKILSNSGNVSSEVDAPSVSPEGGHLGGRLGGVNTGLQTLREIIGWPMQYGQYIQTLGVRVPTGVLLYGPPGCGKTLLVKTVAEEFGAFVHNVTAASVYGAYLGESEARLRQAFADARQKAEATGRPVVLFLDEVDTLCPRRDQRQAHEARVVAQLLTLLDGAASHAFPPGRPQATNPPTPGAPPPPPHNTHPPPPNSTPAAVTASAALPRGHLVVVAATNRPNSVDPALRRPGRLDREISVGVPNAEERTDILRVHTAGLQLDENVDISSIAAGCHGYVGADLAALAREAAMHAMSETALQLLDSYQGDLRAAPLPAAVVREQDFVAAMKRVGPSVVRGYEVQVGPVQWQEIGGLADVKERLQQAVEWPLRHKDAFERLGIAPAKGVLLYGPPGCAKTTLVRAAATAAGAALLPLSCAELYSMYVGEGEGVMREVFTRARLAAPAIVFLDELDAVAAKRQEGHNGGSQGAGGRAGLLSTLLTEMDGMEHATGVLVLGATNRPEALDTAVVRPGRFDTLIYVPPPDVEGRLEVLRLHTSGMPLAHDVDLDALARETANFTGAELSALCSEAALAALREDLAGAREVAGRHFVSARIIVRPGVSAAVVQQYLKWGETNSR